MFIETTTLSSPEFMVNKKHNAIAYHKVRESVTAGTASMAKKIQIIITPSC